MSSDPRRAELDAKVLEWIEEPLWGTDDERFDTLALALFAFQFEHCLPYRRFCENRGRTPEDVQTWVEIPPVPTGAFKEMPLHSFPADRLAHVFRTSGTSLERRGELHLDTLALYEASLLVPFQRFLLPDLHTDREPLIYALAPSPAEVRDSSLSHMFAVAIREIGAEGSRFFLSDGGLELDALLEAMDRVPTDRPVLLGGTAFAFVHLVDALAQRNARLELPVSVRIMETGGFKGRSRSMPRPELYERLEDALGVSVDRIVNQYGMTELGSQFYDSILREPGAVRRKLAPPWTRVRIVEPASHRDVSAEATGTLVITDLANTGSISAIQTADLGRSILEGFEVLGREPGAEERGCSIAADELLDTGKT
ncbi:MAG: long-chain fatty acid--CoA ligase [Myxococcota bacterium]|nr:long-chain fatty acid--CoA ligase [Myxococcota bacterium]